MARDMHAIVLRTDKDGIPYCRKCSRNVTPVGNTIVVGRWPDGRKGSYGGHKSTSLKTVLSRPH